jgi:hypothetical protein
MTLSALELQWVRDRETDILAEGDTLAIEAGYRAWTWSHDVSEFEVPDLYEVREMIAGTTGAYYLEGVPNA